MTASKLVRSNQSPVSMTLFWPKIMISGQVKNGAESALKLLSECIVIQIKEPKPVLAVVTDVYYSNSNGRSAYKAPIKCEP